MARVDITAYQLEVLVAAACQYELVLELLMLIREIHNGHELGPDDSELIRSASLAALVAKAERLNQGIDHPA